MLVVLIVLLLLFGVGGYSYGGPTRGYYYGGSGIGIVLLVILLLYLTGYLGPVRGLR